MYIGLAVFGIWDHNMSFDSASSLQLGKPKVCQDMEILITHIFSVDSYHYVGIRLRNLWFCLGFLMGPYRLGDSQPALS